MFMECIIYMYTVSLDYFNVIQNKLDRIEVEVLEVSDKSYCVGWRKTNVLSLFAETETATGSV